MKGSFVKQKMRTFALNKLVRNGIVVDHERQGCTVDWHVLKGDELLNAAKAKVREEIDETLNSLDVEVSEIGDCIEALYNLAHVHDISREEILKAMETKNTKKGDFSKGHYIATVTVPADSWFAEYYGSDPMRFPEIKANELK